MGSKRGEKIPLTINKNIIKEFMFSLERLLDVLYFKKRGKIGQLLFNKNNGFNFAIYEVEDIFSELYTDTRYFVFEFTQDKHLDISWVYLPTEGIFLKRGSRVFPMDFSTNNACVRYLENVLNVCNYKKDISLLAVVKDEQGRVRTEMRDLERGITYILR